MTNVIARTHFLSGGQSYRRYRPAYPQAMFAWLRDQTAAGELAWDCATGTGQAAIPLAAHYRRVLATDVSAGQLAFARPYLGVDYLLAAAEQMPLADHSVDLITVAQALHWFDLDEFAAEVRRVLRQGGLLAAWTYRRGRVDAGVDAVIDSFHASLGDWWPPERPMVEAGYAGLELPGLVALPAPPTFAMTSHWNRTQLLGYLGTWSAVRACTRHQGRTPLQALDRRLSQAWQNPCELRGVRWPLSLRCWRVE